VFHPNLYLKNRVSTESLEVVPVETDEERQTALKAVNYLDDRMIAFDSFHAATAKNRGISSSDKPYEDVDPERLPLEPIARSEPCLRRTEHTEPIRF